MVLTHPDRQRLVKINENDWCKRCSKLHENRFKSQGSSIIRLLYRTLFHHLVNIILKSCASMAHISSMNFTTSTVKQWYTVISATKNIWLKCSVLESWNQWLRASPMMRFSCVRVYFKYTLITGKHVNCVDTVHHDQKWSSICKICLAEISSGSMLKNFTIACS